MSETEAPIPNTESVSRLVASPEFAWVLGVLCGGGSRNDNKVTVSTQYDFFAEIFAYRASCVFEVEPKHLTAIDSKNGKKRHTVIFKRQALARDVGDIRTYNWARTLFKLHPWILADSNNITHFLSGYIDKNSSIQAPFKGRRHNISLGIKTHESFEWLNEALLSIGVQGAYIARKNKNTQEIQALNIGTFAGLYTLASQVSSFIPHKEYLLSVYRKLPITKVDISPDVVRAYNLALQLANEYGYGPARIHRYFQENNIPVLLTTLSKWLNGVDPRRNKKLRKASYIEVFDQEALERFGEFDTSSDLVIKYVHAFIQYGPINNYYSVINQALVNVHYAQAQLPVLRRKFEQKSWDSKKRGEIENLFYQLNDALMHIKNAENPDSLQIANTVFETKYEKLVNNIF